MIDLTHEFIFACGVALGLYCGTPQCKAADFSYDASNRTLSITGDIERNDGDKLKSYMDTVPFDGTKHMIIKLSSQGGSVAGGVDVAERLQGLHAHGWKLATVVPFAAQCSSSCITLFALGDIRILMGHSPPLQDASLYVHTAAIDGQESEATMALSIVWARTLKAMGVPSEVVGKMLLTSDRGGYKLTPADLKAWGVRWMKVVRGKPMMEDGMPVDFEAKVDD